MEETETIGILREVKCRSDEQEAPRPGVLSARLEICLVPAGILQCLND